MCFEFDSDFLDSLPSGVETTLEFEVVVEIEFTGDYFFFQRTVQFYFLPISNSFAGISKRSILESSRFVLTQSATVSAEESSASFYDILPSLLGLSAVHVVVSLI